MLTICLNKSSVFYYKKTLFFVGKIGVVRVKLFDCSNNVSLYIDEFCFKLIVRKLSMFNFILANNLLSAFLIGSDVGFVHKIILFGIGFRCWNFETEKGIKHILFKIGFSKDLSFRVPLGVKILILKPTLVLCKSMNKNILSQFVASLCLLKISDSYKGRGLLSSEKKPVLKIGKN